MKFALKRQHRFELEQTASNHSKLKHRFSACRHRRSRDAAELHARRAALQQPLGSEHLMLVGGGEGRGMEWMEMETKLIQDELPVLLEESSNRSLGEEKALNALTVPLVLSMNPCAHSHFSEESAGQEPSRSHPWAMMRGPRI